MEHIKKAFILGFQTLHHHHHHHHNDHLCQVSVNVSSYSIASVVLPLGLIAMFSGILFFH
jgi:hypothetical protein